MITIYWRQRMDFSFEQLSEPINRVIQEIGFTEPTEIQSKAIPVLMGKDGDFVGQAQTGTGKTAAFCLPLLERIDFDKKGIQAIILSPTRELANQINSEILRFSQYLPLKTVIVYGGVGYREQIQGLRKAQIVIATPGRTLDLIDRGELRLDNADVLIIDEADEMMNMGFIEDIETIIDEMPSDCLKWMFSATMPSQIVRLMKEKLDSPEIIQLKKKTLSNENIQQSYCCLPRKNFFNALRFLLVSEEDLYGIIFCETREETKRLAEKLQGIGRNVASLHGDLNQRQRDFAMASFRDRRAEILVCTDVAARGLDVSNVTHVINIGLPRTRENYVHRIGRTGRAGQIGKAISLISPSESRGLRDVERLTKQKLTPFPLPNREELKRTRVNRELEKMVHLRNAIVEKGQDFRIDDSFEHFKGELGNLSEDEVLKLLFSHIFNGDFRSIDESLENLKHAMSLQERSGERSRSRNRDRGGRRGGRDGNRSGRSGDRDRKRRSRSGNGGDRDRDRSRTDRGSRGKSAGRSRDESRGNRKRSSGGDRRRRAQ